MIASPTTTEMKTLPNRISGTCPHRFLIILIILLTMSSPTKLSRAIAHATMPPDSAKRHVVIDFSGYTGGPVQRWLEGRGFRLEKDAKNPKLLRLSITEHLLRLEANGPMSGFLLNDSINFDDLKTIRITWGVKQYPHETSYEKKVNNEALMLYLFFGSEKVRSGSMLIPASPYFIGLFLCQNEKVNSPYKGLYYHNSGRFVCLGKPPQGEMIVSEFDLDRAFKSYFNKNAPGITGIGFGIDTSKAANGGKSAAFIKSIEFFAERGLGPTHAIG